MNTDMLQKKLSDINSTNLSEDLVKEFNQLSAFIEASMGAMIKLDGPEKAKSSLDTLIKLRDYMQSAVTQDGYRRFLLSEINDALNYEPPEVLPEDDSEQEVKKEVKKK